MAGNDESTATHADATRRMIAYWRDTLIEAMEMDIDERKVATATTASGADVARGQLDAVVTERLIRAHEERCRQATPPEDPASAPHVMIAPVVLAPSRGGGAGRRIPLLWVPATLERNGRLLPSDEKLPWIPRGVLEPTGEGELTIGLMDERDDFVRQTPEPEAPQGWDAWWAYADELFTAVAGAVPGDFALDGYERLGAAPIVFESRAQMAKHIIDLYNRVLEQRQTPALLQRYTAWDDALPEPGAAGLAARDAALRHVGQMNNSFPLSPSQRQALHHALAMADREMLAVTGPPGTGKTTLLHSLIATLWVAAAVRGDEPPIIVATSANNRASKNVIASFESVGERVGADGPLRDLAGRWLPGVASYGLFCASTTQASDEDTQRYQVMYPTGKGFPEDVVGGEDDLGAANAHFLERYAAYAKRPFTDVQEATESLRADLHRVVETIEQGIEVWDRWDAMRAALDGRYGSVERVARAVAERGAAVEVCAGELARAQDAARRERARLDDVVEEWNAYHATTPWWMSVFGFIPSVARQRHAHNKGCFKVAGYPLAIDRYDEDSIYAALTTERGRIEDELRAKEASLGSTLRERKAARETATRDAAWRIRAEQERDAWQRATNVWAGPSDLHDALDTTLRYTAFKLATHYWEGRWLMETHAAMAAGTWTSPQETPWWRVTREAQWRCRAKLTPCFVATLSMAPRFFGAADGMKSAPVACIDLLIVDEAGQVSPEVAGATVALAKRAVMTGDAKQIPPVRGDLTRALDESMARRHGFAVDAAEADAFHLRGLSAFAGTVMRVAQRASRYKIDGLDERGMFLAEHRRCVPEIIGYCNELSYHGKLRPLRPSERRYPLPHMGYAHVASRAKEMGKSWCNVTEAEAIARWIAERRNDLLQSGAGSPARSLKEVIGVVTPFKPQAAALRQALEGHGLADVTAGTIHTFQGSECDIIIFSPVYHASDSFYFDKERYLLNVAVSRAKDSFLVFGNMHIFSPRLNTPSGLLARYLFAAPENEVTDVGPPTRPLLTATADRAFQRLTTHEEHRAQLVECLEAARERAVIVSPFLAAAAVQAYGVPDLVRAAVGRGVRVTVYTDGALNMTSAGTIRPGATQGRDLLVVAGATVKVADRIHNKALACDDVVLVEGSYNWLSARGTADDPWHRYETSVRYAGPMVGDMIAQLTQEMEKRAAGQKAAW